MGPILPARDLNARMGPALEGKLLGANSLKSSSFLDSVGVEFQKQLKTVKMKKT